MDDVFQKYLEKKKFDGMGERARARYERIENTVFDEGYVKKEIHQQDNVGYGDFQSFFEILVDCKLAGSEYPTAQEVFENMKKQINHYKAEVNKYSEEYFKLLNENRALKLDKNELIREK